MTYTEKMVRALNIGASKQYLVTLAWIPKSAYEFLVRYPFVFGMDETEKTCWEDRSLLLGVSSDFEGRNIPWLNDYMPNRRLWTYHWILFEALPTLVGEHVRNRVTLFITDGNRESISAIQSAIDGGVFPNAKHRLCCWHVINRNFYLKAKTE